jgi:hypothetical protein
MLTLKGHMLEGKGKVFKLKQKPPPFSKNEHQNTSLFDLPFGIYK